MRGMGFEVELMKTAIFLAVNGILREMMLQFKAKKLWREVGSSSCHPDGWVYGTWPPYGNSFLTREEEWISRIVPQWLVAGQVEVPCLLIISIQPSPKSKV
ncbi:hypothetical protein OIU79_029093 [Salix purpurea]|uniref:Uncharacterized protein n=1 Tax=Salix purpurea TaxID=77065 RepID=A0A9Q1A3H2_SALPP|nr:hypothetical protein OIU79_029093 [Salix purpurea]